MKKTLFVLVILASVYGVGYKSRDFVRDKIYIPIKEARLFEKKISIHDYEKVACPTIGMQIAIFGQSNSTNTVVPREAIEIPDNLYQYDWRRKKCFKYKEPLLGVDGIDGNAISYMAINIANDTSKPLVIIPFGVESSSVLQWAYGYLSYHQHLALKSIKNNGFSPTIFLYHQGESDAPRSHKTSPDILKNLTNFKAPEDLGFGITKEYYSDALQTVLVRTRKYFPDSYFGVALVSRYCGNEEWVPIREAQEEISTKNSRSFISADSDKIYTSGTRQPPGCPHHFTPKGAKELGQSYYSSVFKILKNYYTKR